MSENILHREIDNQDLALLGIFIGYSLLANPMGCCVRSKNAATTYILNTLENWAMNLSRMTSFEHEIWVQFFDVHIEKRCC